MILFVTYIEDVTLDNAATERGFLHMDNRTTIHYGGWISDGSKWRYLQ